MRGLVIAIGTLVATGCYSFVPLGSPDPRPGIQVLAELTDLGSTHYSGYLGPSVDAVSGRVISTDSVELALSVVSVRMRDGQTNSWNGESVTLPRSVIARIRERKLAKGSTILVGGGVTAVALLAIEAFTGGIFGTDKGGPPPPGQ